jgi:hypothetical protein
MKSTRLQPESIPQTAGRRPGATVEGSASKVIPSTPSERRRRTCWREVWECRDKWFSWYKRRIQDKRRKRKGMKKPAPGSLDEDDISIQPHER